jgi:hypothetical protein
MLNIMIEPSLKMVKRDWSWCFFEDIPQSYRRKNFVDLLFRELLNMVSLLGTSGSKVSSGVYVAVLIS